MKTMLSVLLNLITGLPAKAGCLFTCIYISFCIKNVAHSQPYVFLFEQFTTEQGLSHESIQSITKDRDGFLWIGTVNGLNRFDGIRFTVFRNDPADPHSLPGNYIAGTTLDNQGYLWIATNRGLCRMDTRTLRLDKINLATAGDTMPRYETMYGQFDKKGTGWFIVSGILYAVNEKTFQWERYPLPTANYHANMVQIDSRGRIWMTIGRAKYLFDPVIKRFRYLTGYDNHHTDSKILCGWIQEHEGKIWMSTWSHGFMTWNDEKEVFEKQEGPIESLTHFLFDKTDNGRSFIWCGGGSFGLMVYDIAGKKYIHFTNDPKDPLTHNLGQSTFFFKDSSSGIVWIGTENGLQKYDPLSIRFHRYRIWQDEKKFLNSQYFFPTGFVQDKTDPAGKTWWVGVWIGGLYKWNRGSAKPGDEFTEVPGLKENGVFSLIQSKDGNLWVGHGLGVQVFDPKSGKFTKHLVNFFPDTGKRRIVTFIAEDAGSNMWFATYQGLYSWQRKGDSVINWSRQLPELDGVNPLNIQEDSRGYIWVSTTKGIFRIDPKKKQAVLINNQVRKNKLPDDAVGALFIDHAENFWVAGVDYLAKLDRQGEVIQLYTNKNGFLATSVYTILEDPQHFLWIATDNRIHRLNPATGHFDYFDKSDGLFSNKAADGFYLSPGGEILIGYNGNINSIHYNKIAFNTTPPKPAVSRLYVQGQPSHFDEHNKVVIRPGERNLLIEFAALNFSQPAKNKFAFKLDGYDTTWRVTSERSITLMNLEGGLHRLHVKAANNDGIWSDETVYFLKVIPPFHKTIWFRLLMAAALGCILLLVIWYRRGQRKKLERIRNRIATDLHDDMGSTLSSIRIFSDVAKKQIEQEKPETVQLLDRISQNATSLSENMQDIIWTIRSDNDTLDDLVFRMREFGLRVCDAKQIRFNVEVSKYFKASRLSLEQRRNLYMIFKEALNNTVKYADCSQVGLILTQMGRYLRMEITDNGKGFDPATVKRGNGLNNLEKRAKEIGGNLEIQSQPGQGTAIGLIMRMKRMLPDKQ
jgi:ligand-binding sensor domain-containing protein/two-component sensor histidine kinase